MRHKISFVISFFFIALFISTGISHGLSIPSYDVSKENTSLGPFDLYVIKDETMKLSIDDVASGSIHGELTSSRFYIQSTNTNYWFCFTLTNNSQKQIARVIHLDEPFAHDVDLYYRAKNTWHHDQAGLAIPLNERLINNRNPVFTIRIAPHQSITIYIKLHSNYGMLTIGCFVEEPSAFLKREQLVTACYFFYFGTVFALLMYNTFLFFSLREKLYAYYVLHGLCFGAWVMLYSGFDLYTGIHESYHYRLNAITNFVLVFLSLFSRELLQTKTNLPKIDTTLLIIAAISLISGITSFIDITYYQYLTFIAFPSYIFFIYVGIYAQAKHIELSSYYLLSMSMYFLGIILLALLLMDLIPYNIVTRYSYLPGSMAELTIFSLALAHRVKLLQKQNMAFQLELIKTERKAKERLEIVVTERTAELMRANNELERMAKQDGLTGLANRRLLDERLHHEWQVLKREKKTLSVIMCDIDYFKLFNDYYGHQEGDKSLTKVAQAIATSLKRPDDLAGRYGGEEFLIILPHTDSKGAVKVATRIEQTIADMALEHVKSKVADHVTLSFGVASMLPCEDIAPEQIVSFADEALYEAKRQGRNRVNTSHQTV
ncbi:diguanylate cyclase [Desulfovibrio inopinatus]|uniref:diguanylate cyclase n=1 Tax=Desulfovibrio inopinatus TaxID=102109 RepID=UPI000487BE4B|nr:diguanylate cyclase [Desulfovibrio inopinatus]